VIYPLIVLAVAVVFAVILFRQYLSRRRPYQLVWAVSLALGALAALFFILFLATDRNEVFFKLYYICGGLLMAAYLGLGEIYLLAPRRWAHGTMIAVVLLSLLGVVLILAAAVSASALHASNVEAGTNIISGPSVAVIAVLNSFGAVAVIGGALYSAWNVWRRNGPVRFLISNVLIAGGTILASLAGTLARLTGNGGAFWALLAVGFVVLFGGFILTTRGPARKPVTQQAIPAT
jgi:hypothetical protein